MAAERTAEVGSWRLWVDTGGTFTDCLAQPPNGRLQRFKLLSDSTLRGRLTLDEGRVHFDLPLEIPDGFLAGLELRLLGEGDGSAAIVASNRDGTLELAEPLRIPPDARAEVRFAEEVPVLAAHIATGRPPGEALPPLDLRLATTRATNALLERSGAETALFVTAGFGDALRIGTQQRPDLFALDIERPEPFYAAVVEIDERRDPRGREVRPLETAGLRQRAEELVAAGFESAAVALVNSYAEAAHESEVERQLRAAGFEHVTRSADVAPLIGFVRRAETAVVNAYLAPDLLAYLDAVAGTLTGGSLRLMTSAGGLQSPGDLRPKDCLLSGPAGGVVGAVRAAAAVGVERVISFDMGGTSTDVARYEGDYEYRFETDLGEAHVLAPALAIETVAAGGGSICRLEGERLRVGPRSAGARPGPASYGAGGPLTLTDVNLLLGRLQPQRFEIPLVVEAAERAFSDLVAAARAVDPGVTPDAVLSGLLEIADERMAEAIRRISVRRGYDPSDYLLVAFGGAGGQHACAVGELLGTQRILVPRDAGLLSAWGLDHAVVERFVERQVLAAAEEFEPRMEELLSELERQAREQVRAEGVPADEIVVRRRLLLLRLAGQDATLTVDQRPRESIEQAFATAYLDQYGYPPPRRPVEVESVRVVASRRGPAMLDAVDIAPRPARPIGSRRVHLGGSWRVVPVFERAGLEAGAFLEGPALVVERFSSVVVTPRWSCRATQSGGLLLERRKV